MAATKPSNEAALSWSKTARFCSVSIPSSSGTRLSDPKLVQVKSSHRLVARIASLPPQCRVEVPVSVAKCSIGREGVRQPTPRSPMRAFPPAGYGRDSVVASGRGSRPALLVTWLAEIEVAPDSEVVRQLCAAGAFLGPDFDAKWSQVWGVRDVINRPKTSRQISFGGELEAFERLFE